MTPLQDVDEALVAYLVDEGHDLWTDDIRRRAIWEAVIAIVRLRPEYVADEVDVPVENNGRTFVLPDSHVSIIDVYGIIDPDNDDEVCKQLKFKTLTEAVESDACWRHKTGDATSYVYDLSDRYRVHIIGRVPVGYKMKMLATPKIPLFANLNSEMPLRQDVIPEVIDYAMYRLNLREDAPPGKSDETYAAFLRGAGNKLEADLARNPSAHEMMRRAGK